MLLPLRVLNCTDIVATPCASQQTSNSAPTVRPWQPATPVRSAFPPSRPTPARPLLTQSNRVGPRQRPTEPRGLHEPRTQPVKYGDTASRLTDYYSSVALACCLLVVSRL